MLQSLRRANGSREVGRRSAQGDDEIWGGL